MSRTENEYVFRKNRNFKLPVFIILENECTFLFWAAVLVDLSDVFPDLFQLIVKLSSRWFIFRDVYIDWGEWKKTPEWFI